WPLVTHPCGTGTCLCRLRLRPNVRHSTGAPEQIVSSTGTRPIHSGLLDALVERIARSTNSSAVFVSAASPATGASLLAEFPVAAASIQLDRSPSERGADSRWPDGQVVAIPVRSGETVLGWAAAVGPSLDHDRKAEELIRRLAQCATVLLGHESISVPREEK